MKKKLKNMPVSFVTIGDDYNINSFLWKLVIEGKE